jgi:hypothetical protein
MGACTNGTSCVLTVASLQLLKMEALIPAPADCESRSVIKFLNALKKLRRTIQNKRREMLSAGNFVLQDNARPHTVRRTASLMQEFSWEVFIHPPYSPDLAPSDFHLFLHLTQQIPSAF